MTDATAPELYPQYCFQLSPTINRWCHLRIADIQALTSHPGFQGQDVYFHLNHPLKWVRASGVVVAIDEWEARHIYTLDDGSGATIQCVVNLPRPAPGTTTTTYTTYTTFNTLNPPPLPPTIDAPIDVGHVLDVKGSVSTFREAKIIRAEKVVHLRSTEQEVGFWEKVAALRREVLCRPWVLDRREVRRCRREEEGRGPAGRRGGEKRKRGEGERRQARVTGLEKNSETGIKADLGKRGEMGLERKRETGLEKGSYVGLEIKREIRPEKRRMTGLERKNETALGGKMETSPEKRRVKRVTGLEREVGSVLEKKSERALEEMRLTGLERSDPGLQIKEAMGLERRRVTGLETGDGAGIEKRTVTGLERSGPGLLKGGTGLERKGTTGLERRRVTGLEKGGGAGPELGSVTEPKRKEEREVDKRRVTGLERRASKPVTRVIPVTGKYDALGL